MFPTHEVQILFYIYLFYGVAIVVLLITSVAHGVCKNVIRSQHDGIRKTSKNLHKKELKQQRAPFEDVIVYNILAYINKNCKAGINKSS